MTKRRTSAAFAYQMTSLVNDIFLETDVIWVVLDNLHTHTLSALYRTFPPEKARRVARTLEFHYTPKHGSWLKMVELEFSILVRQCLDRRLPDRERVRREVEAWVQVRNAARATVNWRFTTADARTTLQRLYPQ